MKLIRTRDGLEVDGVNARFKNLLERHPKTPQNYERTLTIWQLYHKLSRFLTLKPRLTD